MSEFKSIESQEALDKIISDRLKRERTKMESEFQEKMAMLENENAELKAKFDGAQKKDSLIEELKGQIKGYEKAELQRKIALEHHIPYSLAERIQGESEEEMIQDAKGLSEYFTKKEVVAPLKDPDMGTKTGGAYEELLQGLNLKGE